MNHYFLQMTWKDLGARFMFVLSSAKKGKFQNML